MTSTPANTVRVAAEVHRVPAYDPDTGAHLWVVTAYWKVNPSDDGLPILDRENMISLFGPMCYWCERAYSPAVEAERCLGRPVKSCPHDPMTMVGRPIGQYHCPDCNCMVLAGVSHGVTGHDDGCPYEPKVN